MSKLKNYRDEIDDIDKELVKLFTKRLVLVKEVAKTKETLNNAVLNNEREEEVIEKTSKTAGELGKQIATIMKTVMRISREKQYEIICDNNLDWELRKLIETSKNQNIEAKNIVYCGMSGSYSEMAANIMYPNSIPVGQKSFEDACIMVQNGQADIAVVPLENSTAGTVNEVYDLLPKYELYIIQAFSSEIENCLLGVKGSKLSDIKEVISHPQALMQCDKLIKQMNLAVTPCDNTAFAAEMVSKRNDKSISAIASQKTAKEYSLDILISSVNNEITNQTRFVALSKNPRIVSSANRVSIAFKLANQSGSLASVLSIFADLNLNLVKIQSRPIPHKAWEYMFYLDFTAEIDNKDAYTALYHLEKELPYLSFLGWYKEEN